jgi:hypothetical protein
MKKYYKPSIENPFKIEKIIFHFKLKNEKFQDTKKLHSQIFKIENYLKKRYFIDSIKAEIFIGFNEDDFVKDKRTIRYTFFI